MDQEIADVIRRGVEAKDLDYKGPAYWDEADKKACCELVKDVLAMANTLGGYLIVGVAETAGKFTWQGLSADQLKSWDTTRLNRFIQNYADPPINTRLVKAEADGKQFVVIVIPPFHSTPHVCQKDFPGVLSATTLYIRTANNESAPIKGSTDFSELIERAVRNRRDQLLEAVRTIITGASVTAQPSDRDQFKAQARTVLELAEQSDPLKDKGYTGYLVSVMHPSRFASDRFTVQDLRAAATAASVNFRGWPFIYVGSRKETVTTEDGIRTMIAWRPFSRDSFDFWEFKQSGLFVHKTLPREEAEATLDREGRRVLDPNTVIFYSAEAIDALVRLYEALGLEDEEITWRMTIFGTDQRALYALDQTRYLHSGFISHIGSVGHEQTHGLEEWRAGLADFAVAACRDIFLRFQWDDPAESMLRDWIKRLLERRL